MDTSITQVTPTVVTMTHMGDDMDELAVPEFSMAYDHATMRPERDADKWATV